MRSKRLFNSQTLWGLRTYLITKIEISGSKGHNFSHIQEMNIRFKTDLRNMKYSQFLAQPRQMIEFCVDKNLHENPEPLKRFENISHPLVGKDKPLMKDRVYEVFPVVINNVCIGI